MHFSRDDKVEIIKTSNSTTSFYPATIILHEPHQTLNTTKKRKKFINNEEDEDESEKEDQLFMVEYKTPQNDVVSYVNSCEIRPVPPESNFDDCRKFDEGEIVDVLVDGYWIKGSILGVLYEGSKYLVRIGDDDDDDVPIEVPRSFLRVHRDWIHGSWFPPFDFDKKDSANIEHDAISRSQKITEVIRTDANGKQLKIKLRIRDTKGLLGANFSPGTAVEVRSDEYGYEGSWYSAIVVGPAGVGKILVEYQTLKTEDELELLKEAANEQDIRPCPPEISQSYRYKALEEVDAWYNDGWWEGVIYEVLDDMKYIVYFVTTNEKLVYQHSNLRPHQNWVDGKWIPAFPHRSSDLKLRKSSDKKANQSGAAGRFCKGAVVEVRSDEPGYEGSWYSAVIVRSARKSTYVVEYMKLKTEDNKEFLKEEAEGRNIRPCPPKIQISRCFILHEKVDAWHNDGWWEGVISKVLDDKKYMVYFETNNEELEYDHVNLRTRQEWINGSWIATNKDIDVLTDKLI